jgi:FkbM family methyltransferase
MSESCQIRNLTSIYELYFPDKVDGLFVDVGAHNGYEFSNTWGLAQAGWSGICVEPVPELAADCRKLYLDNSKITTLEMCIGNFTGEVKLYLTGNPTIDEETVNMSPWDCVYDKNNFMMSPISTLDDVLIKNDITSKFQVLSIDVEGAELHVLTGFTWQMWMPNMIIIETHENNPDSRKSYHVDAINKWFDGTIYHKIQIDGLNAIYVLDVK